MPTKSRHLASVGKIGGLGLSVITGLSIPLSSPSASGATQTPFALMSLAVHDAVKGGWVHEVERATAPGRSFSMNNEIGTTEGRQIIVSSGAHAEVILLGKTAYIYGDDKAVKSYFQLSTTDPAKFANKWLSLTASSSNFADVTSAVTLQSDFQSVTIPGVLKEGKPVELNGQLAVPISGTIPQTASNATIKATLYVSKSLPVLPLEFHLASATETYVVTWSQWGHSVVLAAPKNARPLANPAT
jgi:hypothetical protein